MNIQADEYRPNWLTSKIQKKALEDEVEYLQYGNINSDYYNNFMIDSNVRPSAWSKFPTQDNPNGKYKFTSLEITYSQDQLTFNRQTYSILEWLGDLGGLFGSLSTIGAILVAPLSSFALNTELMTKIFRWRPSKPI